MTRNFNDLFTTAIHLYKALTTGYDLARVYDDDGEFLGFFFPLCLIVLISVLLPF